MGRARDRASQMIVHPYTVEPGPLSHHRPGSHLPPARTKGLQQEVDQHAANLVAARNSTPGTSRQAGPDCQKPGSGPPSPWWLESVSATPVFPTGITVTSSRGKRHAQRKSRTVTTPSRNRRPRPAPAQNETPSVRARNAPAPWRAGRCSGVGQVDGSQDLHGVRGPGHGGKGGTIKRITERVSPRVFRVVALPAPTDREKSQMYLQRYVPHLPAAGEVVIFDRSWYNRAGVERVMGFCSPGGDRPLPRSGPRRGKSHG